MMNVGDRTGYKDRKGNEVLIGSELRLSNHRRGKVVYMGIIACVTDTYKDSFMNDCQEIMGITTALEYFKAVVAKEKKK